MERAVAGTDSASPAMNVRLEMLNVDAMTDVSNSRASGDCAKTIQFVAWGEGRWKGFGKPRARWLCELHHLSGIGATLS
jgi:hypothetical protein